METTFPGSSSDSLWTFPLAGKLIEWNNTTVRFWLRSLLPTQIDQYLNDLNADLVGLRQLLEEDATLQALARSPLMLNILSLAYEGIDPEDIPQTTVEVHRQQIFNTYIDRMLKRRGVAVQYSPAQTIRWLSWLAQQRVHFAVMPLWPLL